MHTEQKVWSNWSLGRQNYLNYPTFTEYFVITWLFSAYVLLWGPLFVGAPVRPNMLNMPKSASATTFPSYIWGRAIVHWHADADRQTHRRG